MHHAGTGQRTGMTSDASFHAGCDKLFHDVVPCVVCDLISLGVRIPSLRTMRSRAWHAIGMAGEAGQSRSVGYG